jgi:hypothetical protein
MVYATSDPQWSTSEFEPIDALRLDSDDLSLFFLGYSGVYMDEVNDPWFAAHRAEVFDTPIEIMSTRYSRDAAISTVACTDRHQFCTTAGVCTPFGGFDQIQNDKVFNDALRPNQNATFNRMLYAVDSASIRSVVDGLSITNTPLRANEKLAIGSFITSLDLPNDQWEQEIHYWYSIAMAQLQRTIVQYATGQIAPRAEALEPPELDQDRWFCRSLLIPSTVYQSFSILKIILIILFGVLIIIVSLSIESLARSVKRCFGKGGAATKWDDDDMLRLRRDMRESMWKREAPDTPQLGLDVSDSGQTTPPPPVPPKDRIHSPPAVLLRDKMSTEHPSIRLVPSVIAHPAPCDTRSSSPTLPAEDRGHPFADDPMQRHRNHLIVDNVVDHRAGRESWMAISLNDIEATITSTPSKAMHRDHRADRDSNQHLGPSTPSVMQRFKSPFNFHVPRTPGPWV